MTRDELIHRIIRACELSTSYKDSNTLANILARIIKNNAELTEKELADLKSILGEQ